MPSIDVRREAPLRCSFFLRIVYGLKMQARHFCSMLKSCFKAVSTLFKPWRLDVTHGVPQQSLQQLINHTQQTVQLVKNNFRNGKIQQRRIFLSECVISVAIRRSTLCWRRQRG